MLPVQLLHRYFESVPTKEFEELKVALQIGQKEIPKGGALLRPSERSRYVFLLLSGEAHAVCYASDGREVDYTVFKAGDLLSEASDYLRGCKNECSVFADTDCTVLYFPYEVLEKSDHPLSPHVSKALWYSFAVQYEALKQRVRHLTCGSLREKIISYLDRETHGTEWFEIPLDRSGLASYLFCDRTALCRELSCMKKEGIIDFKKNKFCFLRLGIAKND